MRHAAGDFLRRSAVSGRIPAPLIRVRHHVLASLPPAWSWRAISWGSYALTKPELRVIREAVPPNLISIDVGANVGVHTYFLSRWSRHVLAYEPNPRLADYLHRAVPRNVTVEAIALSDRTGATTLSVPRLHGVQADPYASLESNVVRLRAAEFEDAADNVVVQATRLDDASVSNVGFIKIDVEGHEQAVLRGARETIEREQPTLLVELDQRYLDRPLDDVLESIARMGYEGSFVLEGQVKPLDQFSVDRHQTQPLAENGAGPFVENFLFRPDGRQGASRSA